MSVLGVLKPDFNEGMDTRLVSQGQSVFRLRSFIWLVALASSLLYQLFQDDFIGYEVWFPVLSLLGIHLSLQATLETFRFSFFEKVYGRVTLFAIDLVLAFSLCWFSGNHRSVFILLVSATLIVVGMSLPLVWGMIFAFLSSILFNLLLLKSFDVGGGAAVFTLVINNGAFFILALLGRFLGARDSALVTELQQSQNRVEELHDLNQLVFENIATGLIATNPFGMIVYVNDAGKKLLKDIPFVDRNVGDLFLSLGEELRESGGFRAKDVLHRHESPIQISSKEELTYETLTSPLLSQSGVFQGYLVFFQDLTLVKRFEHELRQKEKLAAVGQLAAGIAHEIRNPLASISGSIQLMTSSSEHLNADDKKLMSIVLKEIDRLNLLITDFLDFARPEDARQFEPVDLHHLMKDVQESLTFNKDLRSDVQIVWDFQASLTPTGDKNKLRQVFLNLFINAYHAMEKTEHAQLTVLTHDENNFFVVRVRDTGSGIPSSEVDRVFEPFHTTKTKGTGLGLAVTHKILEAHDAKVSVHSLMGEGTEFRIFFPAERDHFPSPELDQKIS